MQNVSLIDDDQLMEANLIFMLKKDVVNNGLKCCTQKIVATHNDKLFIKFMHLEKDVCGPKVHCFYKAVICQKSDGWHVWKNNMNQGMTLDNAQVVTFFDQIVSELKADHVKYHEKHDQEEYPAFSVARDYLYKIIGKSNDVMIGGKRKPTKTPTKKSTKKPTKKHIKK